MKNHSFAFRTVSDITVVWAGWELRMDSGWCPVGNVIPGWDYHTSLEMRTGVDFEHDAIISDTGLPPGSEMLLSLRMVCRDTMQSILLFRERFGLESSGRSRYLPTFTIPADRIAGSFDLRAELTLEEAAADDLSFVAREKGSRLGSWSWRIDIEGSSSRMPVEILDFETSMRASAASEARWFVGWSSKHLHTPVNRQLRLYINQKHTAFKALVEQNDAVVSSILSVAIAQSMIDVVLDDDEMVLDPEAFPEGSLGSTASTMIRLCFPGFTLLDIRIMRQQRRDRYSSYIQATYWED